MGQKQTVEEAANLHLIFSNIPLDIEGSNISFTGWIPSEAERKYMDDDSIAKAIKEGEGKNSKVLFKNISLNWDSCDCGDGYGCSHGNWVYEIDITTKGNSHTLDIDDSGVTAYNNHRQSMIPAKDVSVYDFYRMCEMCGIELELSDYANSLLASLPTNSMPVDNDFINKILKIAYKAVPKKCVIDGNKLIEVHNELGDVLKSEFQKQLPSAPTEPNGNTSNQTL